VTTQLGRSLEERDRLISELQEDGNFDPNRWLEDIRRYLSKEATMNSIRVRIAHTEYGPIHLDLQEPLIRLVQRNERGNTFYIKVTSIIKNFRRNTPPREIILRAGLLNTN
jgi:hypothetical protein